MKYYVIGDDDAALGFGMVGVQGRAASSEAEAAAAFDGAIADPDVGIIIVTERVADLIRPRVDRYLFAETFPLIVEIPDRRGPMEGRLGIREMVNKAIGINLG